MSYQNRLPPEGINVSRKPWGGELMLRLLVALIVIGILGWLLLQSLTYAARWVPVSYEQRLMGDWLTASGEDPRQTYLQNLANSLARAGGLDEDIPLTVHLHEGEIINAFATLGGHVVVYEGLLEALETEEALAFVLAHEVAHIQLRHPIQGLSRQVGSSIVLALVFGHSDLGGIAGAGGNLALLSYSRAFERAADDWAYAALAEHYGHLHGSEALFEALDEAHPHSLPAWLGTHPDIEERLQRRKSWAKENKVPLRGELTALATVLPAD